MTGKDIAHHVFNGANVNELFDLVFSRNDYDTLIGDALNDVIKQLSTGERGAVLFYVTDLISHRNRRQLLGGGVHE